MSPRQTGQGAPLLRLRGMRPQNGPSLSLGQQLRLFLQLQILHAVSGIRAALLHLHLSHVLAVFYFFLEGDSPHNIHWAKIFF